MTIQQELDTGKKQDMHESQYHDQYSKTNSTTNDKQHSSSLTLNTEVGSGIIRPYDDRVSVVPLKMLMERNAAKDNKRNKSMLY